MIGRAKSHLSADMVITRDFENSVRMIVARQRESMIARKQSDLLPFTREVSQTHPAWTSLVPLLKKEGEKNTNSRKRVSLSSPTGVL